MDYIILIRNTGGFGSLLEPMGPDEPKYNLVKPQVLNLIASMALRIGETLLHVSCLLGLSVRRAQPVVCRSIVM